MVERLGEGPATVKELARPLPMSLAAVMQHLQVLQRAGLVASEKKGRARVCQLEVERLGTLNDWIAERRNSWERRFDRLEQFLAEESGDTRK